MSTIEQAWTAFMSAIDEARELHRGGAHAGELAELMRHARELLDIIEAEAAEQSIAMPPKAGAVLDQMRDRLSQFESQVKPTAH
jgi:ElaB/YqjD/DUF883 family membrane-anchored ribosome-binding protein